LKNKKELKNKRELKNIKKKEKHPAPPRPTPAVDGANLPWVLISL
jgi:hypothetical protein